MIDLAPSCIKSSSQPIAYMNVTWYGWSRKGPDGTQIQIEQEMHLNTASVSHFKHSQSLWTLPCMNGTWRGWSRKGADGAQIQFEQEMHLITASVSHFKHSQSLWTLQCMNGPYIPPSSFNYKSHAISYFNIRHIELIMNMCRQEYKVIENATNILKHG